MKNYAACAMVCGLCAVSSAAGIDGRGFFQTDVDVSGAVVYGAVGDSENTRIAVTGGGIAEYVQVGAIGWDLELLTADGSWFSEMRVRVSNGEGDFFDIAPGAGDDFGGFGGYSSGGLVSVVDSGEAFFVGIDDTVYLEFYNEFDELNGIFGGLDATVLSGSITIGTRVPSPGGVGVLMLGGVVVCARRRR